MPVLSPVDGPVLSVLERAATGITDALRAIRFVALQARRTGTFVTFAGEHPPRFHVTLVPLVPLVTFRGRG